MLGSLNQRIRRPISLWLKINSLSTVHLEIKGLQTKGNMNKALNILQKDMGPSVKIEEQNSFLQSVLFRQKLLKIF